MPDGSALLEPFFGSAPVTAAMGSLSGTLLGRCSRGSGAVYHFGIAAKPEGEGRISQKSLNSFSNDYLSASSCLGTKIPCEVLSCDKKSGHASDLSGIGLQIQPEPEN